MQKITVSAELNKLDDVEQFIQTCLKDCGASRKTLMQIRLAVEEIFVNIASYAYGASIGPVEVRCDTFDDPMRTVICFLDAGTPFDPLAKEDADTSADALMEREGGLGILLVKETMDEMHYEYKDGKNVLSFTKRL